MPARKVRVIKKREEWVRRFKIPLVKGTPLHVAETIGTRYGDRLVRLIDRMTAQCKREVLASLRENLPDDMVGDASPANQVQIVFNGLRKKWEEAFGRIAKPTVDIWAEQVSKDSEKKLATSLKELSGDLTLEPVDAARRPQVGFDVVQMGERLPAVADHGPDNRNLRRLLRL